MAYVVFIITLAAALAAEHFVYSRRRERDNEEYRRLRDERFDEYWSNYKKAVAEVAKANMKKEADNA